MKTTAMEIRRRGARQPLLRQRLATPLALAVGLAIVVTLAGAEWQASRSAWPASSWQAQLERLTLALADQDLDAAADAWADAYWNALDADRDWRGPVAVAGAWQELARRSRHDPATFSSTRKLYLIALDRARGRGDLEGVIVIGNALGDLGDLDGTEECLRIARRLAASASSEEPLAALQAFEARVAAVLGNHDSDRPAR